MNTGITEVELRAFEEAFDSSAVNAVAMNAVVNNGLVNTAKSCELAQKKNYAFSLSLEQGAVTNQEKSGRCWLFAALNTMRFHMIQEQKLKNFELSQAYLFFYDKLEKSNYFLENILETLEEPVNGRLVSFLLQGPVGDGGQ